MFIDETVISVEAGDGGNGCYAHERQKYIPRGRPDGGNGGRGASIYVQCSPNIHTLQDVSYRRKYKGERGAHGRGSNREGKSANDIIIQVPVGTILFHEETGRILHDCLDSNKKYLVAKGGPGGKGNAALATRKDPDPEQCQPGKPGEKLKVRVSLKILADVGLVGRPNAGKSTFLSCISRARPKIADYPFTTTEPHLGIVVYPRTHDSIVVADIPGLIEDSHKGRGLGIRFLKHIERTSVLALLVPSTENDPAAEAAVLLDELRHYSTTLAEKPVCFIQTKSDILTDTEESPALPKGWFRVSSVSGDGVQAVLDHLKGLVTAHRESTFAEDE